MHTEASGQLHQRKSATVKGSGGDSDYVPGSYAHTGTEPESQEAEVGCCPRVSRWMQNTSYQLMAKTFWDSLMSGFRPGRLRAMSLLNIQPTDKVLLVGEGSGLDFDCLPDNVNKKELRAFDFSSEMVRQSKAKARQYGIPEANCFEGDAQAMPFTTEKFDKIFFPLSLASIPNPTLALQEAERVLAKGGKIVLIEKLLDDGAQVSWGRKGLNYITNATFADINRNLTEMLGDNSPLKVVHYESLGGQLQGVFASTIAPYYRAAVIVRGCDFEDTPAIGARLGR